MACTPTPTQTLFEVLTTTTASTSFTEFVSTVPPELTTLATTICLISTVDPLGNTTCIASRTQDITSTIQGEELTTITSTIVQDVIVTESEATATLFSACPTASNTTIPTSPPTGSVIVSASASASTLPNGSVIVSWVTYTSTLPPQTSIVPTSLSGADGSHDGSAKDDLGPIIGGALGGFVGFVVLSVLLWFIWRKQDKFRNMYPKDQFPNWEPSVYPSWSRREKTNGPPPEPQPYQYGRVGRQPGSPSRESSPSPSPAPTRPQSLAFTALSPTPYSPGFPVGPVTPNSGLVPSPYTPNFPSQPPTPGANANAFHASPPYTPVRSVTPVPPSRPVSTPPQPVSSPPAPAATISPASPPPAPVTVTPPVHPVSHHSSVSVASVGTAVSYPYPVFPPRPSDDNNVADDEGSSVSERRPTRMSLTLANWNPETDGELYSRASLDEGPGTPRPGPGPGTGPS